jgi:uncharacterized membrane protein YgcG
MSVRAGFGRRPSERAGSAGRALGAVAVLIVAAALPVFAPAPSACAAGGPHAGLVVDTGREVVEYCVSLPGGTVSGTQLIQLASDQHGLDYRLGFGGKAVCRLDEVGTDSGDCFDHFPDFWGYWRAGPTGSWAWSSTGAADTSVKSGDLEGWVWGTGQDGATHPSPPAATIDGVCGSGATPPPGSGGGSGGGHGGGGSGGGRGGGGSGGSGGSTGGSGGRNAGSGANDPSPGAESSSDPASAAAQTGSHRDVASADAGATSGVVTSPEGPTMVGTSPASPAPGSTEAAIAPTSGSAGAPIGALFALAAALGLGIGGALILRRSGVRGR